MARKQQFDGGTTGGTAGGGSFLTDGKILSLPLISKAVFSSSWQGTHRGTGSGGCIGYARASENQFGIAKWGRDISSPFIRISGQAFQIDSSGSITLGTSSSNSSFSSANFSTTTNLEVYPGRIAFVGYLYGSQGTWSQHGAAVQFGTNNTVIHSSQQNQGTYGTGGTTTWLWPNDTLSIVRQGQSGTTGYFTILGYNQNGYGGFNTFSLSSGALPANESNFQFCQVSSSGIAIRTLAAWNDTQRSESAVIHYPSSGNQFDVTLLYGAGSRAGSVTKAYTAFGDDPNSNNYSHTIPLKLADDRVAYINGYSSTSGIVQGKAFVTNNFGTILATGKTVSGFPEAGLRNVSSSSSNMYASVALGNGYFMIPDFRGILNIFRVSIDGSYNLTWTEVAKLSNESANMGYVGSDLSNSQNFAMVETVNANNILVVATGNGVSTYDFSSIKELLV